MRATDCLRTVGINEIVGKSCYASSMTDGNDSNLTKEFTIKALRKVKFKSCSLATIREVRGRLIFIRVPS